MSRHAHKKYLVFPALLLVFTFLVTTVVGLYRTKDISSVSANDSITNAVYQDLNSDGSIDNIRWTMDEDVTSSLGCFFSFLDGDWTVDDPGDMNIVITGVSCSGVDAFIYIAVSADPFITGSSTDPVISYTNQGNPDEIALTSGPMTDKLGVSAADNAAPILIPPFAIPNPQYLDPGFDGQIDQTDLYFTESVTYTYDDTDWTAVANDLTGYDVTGCISCIGAFPLQLSATANFGITGVSGGTEPTLEFTASINNITDGVSNAVVPFAPTSLVDQAAPVLVSAVYLDTDVDGTIDTIRTTWSEDVTMSGSTSNDWLIGPGDINVVFASAPDDVIPGLTLDILVTADAGETGGAIAPDIAYDNSDTNDSVIDSPMPAVTNTPTAVLDGAAPLITSLSTLDSNGDGITDGLNVTYTETLEDTAAGSNGLDVTTVSDHGSCTGESADPSASSSLQFTFLCTNVFTAVGDLTYDFLANVGIADASGNQSPTVILDSGTTPAITDGAAPVVTGVTMLDTNLDGIVNRVAFTFSENLANTAAGANGFDVTSASNFGSCTGETADPAVSAALNLDFLCTNVFTAVGDLNVTLTANAGIVDAASNQSVTKSFTAVSTPAIVDAASPKLISWAIDLVTKKLSSNFSESVDASTLVATAITVQDAATATTSVTLTGGTTASADGTTIVVDMLTVDVNAIIANPSLGKTVANTYLRITSGLITDLVANAVDAIVDGSALQAAGVTVPSPAGSTHRSQEICGDGVIENPNFNGQNETCDDGNLVTGDGCSGMCTVEQHTSGGGGGGGGSSNTGATSVNLHSSAIGTLSDLIDVSETFDEEEDQPFSDIVGDAEEAAIRQLIAKGVVTGNPDGSFQPRKFLQRAAAIKMIAILIHLTPDVSRAGDLWYSPLLRAMRKAKIIGGEINPDSYERRANFLAFVAKAKNLDITVLPACESKPYRDVVASAWYCPVVQYAKVQGWLRTMGLFQPSAYASRSWAAGVLYRAFPE